MRRFLPALLLLFAPLAFAQNQTIVTGTITDPNGVPYYPATVSACLTPATLYPMVAGQQVNNNPGSNYCFGPVSTASNGSFLMSLWGNALITCSPACPSTQWLFTVVIPGPVAPVGFGPQQFTATITISGNSQDIGATLNAAGVSQLRPAGAATNATNLVGPGSITGTFSGAHILTGALTTGITNNIRTMDGTKYPLTDAGLTNCLTDAGANGTCVVPANTTVPVSSSHSISTASTALRCELGSVLNFTINGRIRMQGVGNSITGCTFNGVGPGTATNVQVVTMENDNQVFTQNTIKNFGINSSGELDPFFGNGGLIANNSFINNADMDIFMQTAASTVMNDWRIVNNYGGVFIAHSTNAGGSINHMTVSGNTFRAGENSKVEFCLEIGAFLGGNTPVDVTSSGNTCTLLSSSTFGGFSFSTINNCTENGDIFDSNGFTASVASFEHVLLSNCTIQGTVSINGTGTPGITCDRCNNTTFTGNVINGFPIAAGNYGIHLVVANTAGPAASNNTFTGNVIIFPSGGVGFGIWEQCNATGANCLNNTYTGNHVLGTGTAGSTCFKIENDVGTISNLLFENNHCTNTQNGINQVGTLSGIILVNNKLTSVTTQYQGTLTGSFIVDVNQGFSGLSVNQSGLWGILNFGNLTGNRTFSLPDASATIPFVIALTSQYTNSTTTFSNVAGGNTIQFAVAANQNYTATCHLYYQAAATGGLNIEFTGPASPTAVRYGMDLPTAITGVASGEADAFGTSIGAVSTAGAVNLDAMVSFSLLNGTNAGTVNLLAKSSAAVQLQIQSGSWCRIQ